MASGRKLKLNIDVSAEEVDTERDQFKINSPTAQNELDENAKKQELPYDKERNEAGLNSPTGPDQDYEANYGSTQNQAPPAGLITSVPRPEEKTSSKSQDIITQIDQPTITKKTKKKTNKSKGWCSCLSAPVSNDEEAVETPKHTHMSEKKATAKPAASVHNEAGSTTKETQADIEREVAGLLGRRLPHLRDKKTLVIDLDETLVHSSFKAVSKCDFIVPVEIDNIVHNVYVLVREGAKEFLNECAKDYEMVLFTASLAKYADPLLDLLDEDRVIDYRLFRDSCVQIGYSYVKDLSQLGRKMSEIMIIDNSPQSYRFQPCNAIPCTSWFDDPRDTELPDLLPVLNTTLRDCKDVRDILDANKTIQWLINQAK